MNEKFFAAYLATRCELGDEHLGTLKRLQSDWRMKAIWQHFKDQAEWVLSTIMYRFQCAAMVPQTQTECEKLAADFRALNAAETLLRKHFSPLLLIAGSCPPAHVTEREEKLMGVQQALDYMRDSLSKQQLAQQFLISLHSIASRETGSPVLAFTTMLCADFKEKFDEQNYGQVATIAQVIYGTDEENLDKALAVESVRKRYERDVKKRLSDSVGPWVSPYKNDQEMLSDD